MSIKPNEIIHQVEPPSLKHPKHYHHYITIILSSTHWTDFLKKQRHSSVMLLLKVLPKRRHHYQYLPFLKRSHWQTPVPFNQNSPWGTTELIGFLTGHMWMVVQGGGSSSLTNRLALKSLHPAETGASPGLHKWSPLPSCSSAIYSSSCN